MMWAGICGDKLIGSYKVDDGVKLTSQTYCQFLDKIFFKWYKSQSRSFKLKCVFMHDNAPSHAANASRQFLERKGISGRKLMMWPPASPDLNPIENLWSIVKKKIYVGGKQYDNKEDLWDAIHTACSLVPRRFLA
jgi:transposase